MIIIVDPMIFWNMWAALRIEFFHAAESLLLWNAEPMGFNLAVWDNHVANNQHSFHPVFTMSFYHCSRPKRPPFLPFVALLYSQNFCWLVYSNQKYIRVGQNAWSLQIFAPQVFFEWYICEMITVWISDHFFKISLFPKEVKDFI